MQGTGRAERAAGETTCNITTNEKGDEARDDELHRRRDRHGAGGGTVVRSRVDHGRAQSNAQKRQEDVRGQRDGNAREDRAPRDFVIGGVDVGVDRARMELRYRDGFGHLGILAGHGSVNAART